jgi:hypothetical protein
MICDRILKFCPKICSEGLRKITKYPSLETHLQTKTQTQNNLNTKQESGVLYAVYLCANFVVILRQYTITGISNFVHHLVF